MTDAEILNCWQAILNAIPKAKFRAVFSDANDVECSLRTGLKGLRLLRGIRQWLLDTPGMGGEESPFVQAIDKVMDRDAPAAAPAPRENGG